jgi:hypothetical protein
MPAVTSSAPWRERASPQLETPGAVRLRERNDTIVGAALDVMDR